MQTIAGIDFETTGLSPAQDARATEIAAVLVQGGQIVGRRHGAPSAGLRPCRPHWEGRESGKATLP